MSGKDAIIAFGIALATMAVVAQSNGELNEDNFVSAFQGEKPETIQTFLEKAKGHQPLSMTDRSILRWVCDSEVQTESIKKAGEIIDSNDLASMDVGINFEFDFEAMSGEALDALNDLGTALQNDDFAQIQILVNGHTDAKGDDAYNLSLSKARAEAVRSRLILDYGIAPDRLIAIGFGEQRLRDPSNPESTTNRRVEIVSLGPISR